MHTLQATRLAPRNSGPGRNPSSTESIFPVSNPHSNKALGTVVIGAIGPGWRDVRTMHFNGLRDTVRMRSAIAGMNLLIEHLLENNTVG